MIKEIEELTKCHTSLTEIIESMEVGNLQCFLKKPLKKLIDKSVIYFLAETIDDITGNIVYIGKTKNFLRRISDHIEENEKEFNKVMFLFVEDSILDEVEEILISCYRPKYNIKQVSYFKKIICNNLDISLNQYNQFYNEFPENYDEIMPNKDTMSTKELFLKLKKWDSDKDGIEIAFFKDHQEKIQLDILKTKEK